jgi:signal peptide peptidase SppA
MQTAHSLIFSLTSGHLLALLPDLARQIPDLMGRSYAEIRALFSTEIHELEARSQRDVVEEAAANQAVPVSGGIARINIIGPITRRAGICDGLFGGSNIEAIRAQLREALASAARSGILLYVDSPGGEVSGVADMADEIRAAAQQKPVHAFVDDLGASAAYWLASASSHVTVSQTGKVGSIGVIAVYRDESAKQEKEGVKNVRVVSSQSPKKAMDLTTDEGLAQMQSHVDNTAELFVNAIAKFRGVPAAAVADDFGQGDVVMGKAAVKRGMADAVGTMSDAMNRLRKGTTKGARAEEELPEMTGEHTPATSEPAPPAGGAAESDHGYRERLLDMNKRGL